MLDDIDKVPADTLAAMLRQLRAGHVDRPARFPQSIILCGGRDVCGGSAFNIKSASLRLADFSERDIRALYDQHTVETG